MYFSSKVIWEQVGTDANFKLKKKLQVDENTIDSDEEENDSDDEDGDDDYWAHIVWGRSIVERMVHIYWELDKKSYRGKIKSFDVETGKHKIKYCDMKWETLDLRLEDFEFE